MYNGDISFTLYANLSSASLHFDFRCQSPKPLPRAPRPQIPRPHRRFGLTTCCRLYGHITHSEVSAFQKPLRRFTTFSLAFAVPSLDLLIPLNIPSFK